MNSLNERLDKLEKDFAQVAQVLDSMITLLELIDTRLVTLEAAKTVFTGVRNFKKVSKDPGDREH